MRKRNAAPSGAAASPAADGAKAPRKSRRRRGRPENTLAIIDRLLAAAAPVKTIEEVRMVSAGEANSGTILLQQARRRGMPAHSIDSKLTAMGKDERAISISGYVYRQMVKYTEHALTKSVIYKRHSRNHLLEQIESFRVGDKNSNREDDLLDAFCYGAAVALGNGEGF